MDTLELFQRLGLALAIGFLIGIERGWQEREGPSGSRVAGIRTFALVGLLGGVWGALFAQVGGVALGLAALGFALGFIVFEWRQSIADNNLSATGLVAGLLTFALGAFAVMGDMAVAGASAVAATALLAEREALHSFLKKVTWPELRAALLLLAMSFVLLPILPDRMVDPWHALNPHRIWLLTILIAVISYAGYIAIRLAGTRRGLLYAGAVGGLVSSTAVTVSYSKLAKLQAETGPEVANAILASWVVSLLRMATLASFIAPPLALPLAVPVVGAAIVLAVAGFLFDHRMKRSATPPKLGLTNPFELGEVLQFGALLGLVMIPAKLLGDNLGQAGLLPLAAVTGLADVDPITLSVSQMLGGAITPATGALAILVAGAANITAKSGLAIAIGGPRLGAGLAAAGALAIAAGGAIHFLLVF
ncbi:MAG TPA: MgtC/SapB family protein [Rhizomicrobium sp.]|nr:MgtC/SapB family protein [Rhizomicrobium sp.]